ncbi:acetolactate synthase AlsS [Frondihabitans australicus]|uniref:Acetolactate synthase large subunit n=1 Tax=Frondihabitans australicus TaxID=386892 RepID=A0A495IK27_9MICO|nr:acetolactate synthase AlsS [Frondihabitans australicus]RKR76323.1 acetolactate synthase large subunit [Frondihabitans australicus]
MSEPIENSIRSAQKAVDVIDANAVPYVFGIPGAKIDALFDALAHGSAATLVVCRHEQNAAFMAAAMGRLTGTPGVVAVTSGPGTSNLATGLLTATTEQDPVVAICGAVPLPTRLKRTHQSMDAAALLSTVTKHVSEVSAPSNVGEAVANAFRVSVTEPQGATAVVLPADVLASATQATITAGAAPASLGPASSTSIADAAAVLLKALRPVILVGLRGATPVASAAIRRLMSATGLPVVETFQAAGVVSRELESHYLGRVGLFRNQPGDDALANADVVLTIGYDPVEYDAALWNGTGDRSIIHLDTVPPDLDVNYQPEVELRGDISATIDELLPDLERMVLREDFLLDAAELRSRLSDIDDDARQWNGADGRVNPGALALKIRDLVDDRTTVTCDVGSVYIYMARHFRSFEPRHLLFSNGQQTLGVALPWAMAACLARPGQPVVSVSGDGGFLFSVQELETAARLDLSFVHVIFRDDSYDMVGFQEQLKYGRKSGVELGPYDIPSLAAAFGATGVVVQGAAEFEAVFTNALQTHGRTLIEVRVDYSRNVDLAALLPEEAFE